MAKEAQKSEKFAQSYTTHKRKEESEFEPRDPWCHSRVVTLSHTELCYNDWLKMAYVEPAVGGTWRAT